MNHSFVNRIFIGVLYQMDFFEKTENSNDQKLAYYVSRIMITPYFGLPFFMISAITSIKFELPSGLIYAILLYPVVCFFTYNFSEVPKYSIDTDKDVLIKFYNFSIWVIGILGSLTIALAFSPLNNIKL